MTLSWLTILFIYFVVSETGIVEPINVIGWLLLIPFLFADIALNEVRMNTGKQVENCRSRTISGYKCSPGRN
jgi:hypothetical protein